MSKKALLVLSGGQDSTTCLYWAMAEGYEIHAITFDYNQRHRIEIAAAKQVAELGRVASHEVIVLGPILKGTSPLVSDAKLDQYKDHHSLPGGLEKTFVPMRNQLFLTIAANRAFVLGIDTIITGVCQEDFGGYPDCRRRFIDALVESIDLGTFTAEAGFPEGCRILTPLMDLTKAESVRLAWGLTDVGFNAYGALAFSHTSYDGQYPPVGHDHATLLRAKGFEEADIPDPLILRAWRDGLLPNLPNSPNYVGPMEEFLDLIP
ncbi:MAG: 7-cyano-7-deazaguanine synthase QueC [Bdellovibrionales bacterium]|nr:7-cyano-7-deazaguanine synthase QueC [Bdellovibrionales bacterium]